MKDYIAINKQLWDARTQHHISSAFYDQDSFISGKSSLQNIELKLLGNVAGKSILHLQCHFGQDTLSLARMGAHVTGIDLSAAAIDVAQKTASDLQLDAEFICCNIYELPQHLDKQFDIVFTSYGTIGWLPDMKAWAAIVARYLKSSGTFIFVEFHPVIWMLDNNFSKIEYSYFNKEAIIENESGTYANKEADIQLESVSWNHSLYEAIQNLISSGLALQEFQEYDSSPYNIFPDATETTDGNFMIKGMEEKLPLVYSLKMIKVR